MMRILACSVIALVLLLPVASRAEVMAGNAAPQVPGFTERHASEVQTVGPLAASLQGKPAVVRIHADWCPACRATQSTIDQLKAAYANKINFVQFDMTNAGTAAASEAEAQRLGLGKFFNATKTATSTVAVIDPRNGRVYQTFYNDGQLADYQKVIDAAITDKLR
jgi:thiol-disulfide isomerase/thioredoxin